MNYNFYDTSSLLLKANNLFDDENEVIGISSITLKELENIKNNSNKDNEIKYSARKILQELNNNINYEIVVFTPYDLKRLAEEYEINNDIKILACAKNFESEHNNITFITNDLSLRFLAIAEGLKVNEVKEEKYQYSGYKEVYLNEEELIYFYSHLNENIYNLYINQYLIIYNKEAKEPIDKLCWTGSTHRTVNYYSFKSEHFGEIRPLKGDIYQILFADSLTHNKITMVKGSAGTGKTIMSFGFLMNKLEKGQIDKIIVFCNTVATKNSAKLGFYPGSRDDKLLDSQIGNLLISKFGGRYIVEQMMNDEKIILLPLSDIRGYDTSGMRAGIYISEAQNMDIELMKLTLQRIGEDSICIIDGDANAQVDDINFSGNNNGMRRVSQVFKGEDIYGEVELRNIHRSKIAQIAERL